MKRFLSVVVAAAVLGCMGSVARAEEEGAAEGSRPEIVVGLKTWMNKMKREAAGESITSNNILLVGPAVEVECSKTHMFAEASYMVSASDYKVSVTEFDPALGSDVVVDKKISRRDIDLAVGYQFNHNVGAFVGYRDSELKEEGMKETSSGALIGVRGSVPVNEELSVFGKASYLFTRTKSDLGTEDAPGWIAQLGVKYAFTKQIAAALGYQLETTKTKDTDVKDTFSGATLDVAYTF